MDVFFAILAVFGIPIIVIAGVVWFLWKLILFFGSAPDWQKPLLVLFGVSESSAEMSSEDFAMMKRLAAKAVKAAKSGDFDAEQNYTVQAFTSFCELKAEEIIRSAQELSNAAVIDSVDDNDTLSAIRPKSEAPLEKKTIKIPTQTEASHAAHVIGANCIAELRERGLLCVKSSVITSIPASKIEDFLVLRSDRLVSGSRAFHLSKKTKVRVAESGGTQLVQDGATSRTSSWGQVNYGTGSDNFSGDSVTKTDISYRQVDSRSLQLLITDRGWQIDRTYFGPQVQNARAFAEMLSSVIDDL